MNSKQSPREIVVNLGWIKQHSLVAVVGLSAILVVLSGSWFILHAYTQPERVWSGMLNTMLSTQSVTKRTLSSQENESIEQLNQLSFVGQPSVHGVVQLQQKATGSPTTEVKTETITTMRNEFSRYISIKTGQKNKAGKSLDYKTVEGIWGKAGEGDSDIGASGNLQKTMLGLLPVANLQSAERQKIIADIGDKKIYQVDFTKAKSEKVNGKAVWTFSVSVKLADYIPVIKQIFEKAGLGSLDNLDAKMYANSPAEQVQVSVDKFSRQIVQLKYADGTSEAYTSYGLNMPIVAPETTIPLSELQQKIQSIR